MQEQKVLAAAIKSRKAYEAIGPYVEDGDFTEQAAIVWAGLADYYKRDADCESCDPASLSGQVARTISSERHRSQFETLIHNLAASEISAANIIFDFIGVKQDAASAILATALLAGKGVETTIPLVEEYEKWAEATTLEGDGTTEVLQGFPLSELSQTYADGELIRLWPGSLNQKLDGGLLRGHHVVIFARPEMGKTMFVINATAGFLAQELRVLYVGNEDPIRDVALRMVCRLTRLTKYEVLANTEAAQNAALEKGYGNLILAPLAPGTPHEIEKLVDEYKPDVLIIDQLRNLRMKEDNRAVQLEKAATAARNIGKRHNLLVISVTQAGDSAGGKAVLEMGDVDSSNTGIPAQADLMVGIGASQEDIDLHRRVISLPKNKRSGRHDYFPVKVDEGCSRILGMEE